MDEGPAGLPEGGKMQSVRFSRTRTAATLLIALGAGAIAAGAGAGARAQDQGQSVDVLIKGGTVYDGSDKKPFVGDVAVTGDRIVYAGPSKAFTAKRTIDAKGKIVTPGFIDPHTHSDAFLNSGQAAERQVPPWIMQGVSTVFIGVDGNGTPNVKDEFAKFKRQGIGPNVVAYVGFGAIRKQVIGEVARAPTAAELATEKSLTAKGMCEGAIGLSAGLFYAPQSYAKTDEVIELAKEAAKRGGIYDTHQRDESSYSIGLINSTKEVLRIGREAHLPVHFSHIKALGVDVRGKAPAVVKLIEDARAGGQTVTANQYPWLASHTTLSAAIVPRWAVDGGYAALIKRFNDPATLARMRTDMRDNLRRRGGPQAILLSTSGLPWTGKYLNQVAEEWHLDPVDAVIRILRQTEQQSIASFTMDDYDVAYFMKQPWVVTSSDGIDGHPREYATFPEKYQVYVKQKKVITLPFFIRHSTGLTADIFGLDHRGYLRPGYYADVAVIDLSNYIPRANYVHWKVLATGVTALLVNGALAVDNGKMTDRLSGRALAHTPTRGSCP
jgi:N-acyl-D-aspartate/D-glutamate deacylase